MLKRYSLKEMEENWSETKKFYFWLLVEVTVLCVRYKFGEISYCVPENLEKTIKIDPEEINRIEKDTGHDVIAFLQHISPQFPEELRPWLHRGLTSYDIGDTALGLQMRFSADIIILKLENLMDAVKRKAYLHKNNPQIGRTHGIHAEPITFGVKLANWFDELSRHRKRMYQMRKNVAVGKISGAVGMYTIDPFIEIEVCSRLGLRPVIATQIISRDIVAEYMSTISNLAASIGKIATNLRLLSQTEIGEIMEPFGKNQKGSSAMPHKKNPVGSENISSLMRVVCSNYQTAYENLATCWHERSLDNSGAERVILADSSVLVDYALNRLTGIIENMRVFPVRMLKNIKLTKGLIFSQEVMMLVAEKSGLPREKAHTLVRDIALECWESGRDFMIALLENESIMKYVTKDELKNCFILEKKLQYVDYIFKKVFGE